MTWEVRMIEVVEARVCEERCSFMTPPFRSLIATAPGPGLMKPASGNIGIGDFEKETGQRLRLVEGEQTILPGLTVLPNGGHTPGHQSVLVSTAEGEVLIPGDIISLAINRDVVGPATPREKEARAFLSRVHRSSWEVLPSHDETMRSHPWYASRDAATTTSGAD